MCGQDFLLEKACSNDLVFQALNFASQGVVKSKNILFGDQVEDLEKSTEDHFVLVAAQPLSGDVLCLLSVDFFGRKDLVDFPWRKFVEKLSELINGFVLMDTGDINPFPMHHYDCKSGWKIVKIEQLDEGDGVYKFC